MTALPSTTKSRRPTGWSPAGYTTIRGTTMCTVARERTRDHIRSPDLSSVDPGTRTSATLNPDADGISSPHEEGDTCGSGVLVESSQRTEAPPVRGSDGWSGPGPPRPSTEATSSTTSVTASPPTCCTGSLAGLFSGAVLIMPTSSVLDLSLSVPSPIHRPPISLVRGFVGRRVRVPPSTPPESSGCEDGSHLKLLGFPGTWPWATPVSSAPRSTDSRHGRTSTVSSPLFPILGCFTLQTSGEYTRFSPAVARSRW